VRFSPRELYLVTRLDFLTIKLAFIGAAMDGLLSVCEADFPMPQLYLGFVRWLERAEAFAAEERRSNYRALAWCHRAVHVGAIYEHHVRDGRP